MENEDSDWEPPSNSGITLKKVKKGLRKKKSSDERDKKEVPHSKGDQVKKRYNFSTKKRVVAGFKCRIEGCTKRFSETRGRKKHENDAHMKTRISCPYPNCFITFSSVDNKNRHRQEVHEKSLEFKCFKINCNKSFSRNDSLERHIKGHDQNLIFCPFKNCEKGLKSSKSIQSHLEKVHQEGVIAKPRCECGKFFKSPGNCNNHRISCESSEIYERQEKNPKINTRKSFSLRKKRAIVNVLTTLGVTETPKKGHSQKILEYVSNSLNVSPKSTIRIFKKRRNLFVEKEKRNFTPVLGETKEERVRRVFGPLQNKHVHQRTSTSRRLGGGGMTQDPRWLEIEERMLQHFLVLREDLTARVSIATMIEVLMKSAAELDYNLVDLVSKTKNPTTVLYDRVYRFLLKYSIRYRKANAQSHISVAEQGRRAGEFLRNVRRLLQDVQSIKLTECFDEVRIFPMACGGKGTQTLHVAGPQEVYLAKYSNPKDAYTLMIYTNTEAEVILTLITQKAIPSHYDSEDIDMGDQGTGKLAVIHGIPVLKVPTGSKAWCSGEVTKAWCQIFLPKVPNGSTLCNYDHAPGHDNVCVKYIIENSGRIVVQTPEEMSKYLQTNDLYINASIQSNLEKHATVKSIQDLFDAAASNGGVVPNEGIPSLGLEDVCKLLFSATSELTEKTIMASFRASGIYLPPDGSKDAELGSGLKDILERAGETIIPTCENEVEFTRVEEISDDEEESGSSVFALPKIVEIDVAPINSSTSLRNSRAKQRDKNNYPQNAVSQSGSSVSPSSNSNPPKRSRSLSLDEQEKKDKKRDSSLASTRLNMVLKSEVKGKRRNKKGNNATKSNKYAFRCRHCLKVYMSYYSAKAKQHDDERGGACPLLALKQLGTKTPTKQDMLDKRLFFRYRDILPVEIVTLSSDDDTGSDDDDGSDSQPFTGFDIIPSRSDYNLVSDEWLMDKLGDDDDGSDSQPFTGFDIIPSRSDYNLVSDEWLMDKLGDVEN